MQRFLSFERLDTPLRRALPQTQQRARAPSLMASATDEQDAAACVAAVLEAMREPAFRTACVNRVLAASESGGVVFVESPLGALKTIAKLLPMTVDRSPEQRFKPLLSRTRAVAVSDLHHVRASPQAARASAT